MTSPAQAWLVDAIIGRQVPAAHPVLRPASLDPRSGLAVYRHAYRARIDEVLRGDFPCLLAWWGQLRFSRWAQRFACERPSRGSTLNRLGASFARWLATRVDAVSADLARYEWAVAEAWYLPIGTPITAESLAGVEDWSTAILVPAPGLRVVRLCTRADHLYQAWRLDRPLRRPPPGQAWVLVLPGPERTLRRVLAPAEARVLRALMRGCPLGQSVAGAKRPSLVQHWFATWLSLHCFTAIRMSPP